MNSRNTFYIISHQISSLGINSLKNKVFCSALIGLQNRNEQLIEAVSQREQPERFDGMPHTNQG